MFWWILSGQCDLAWYWRKERDWWQWFADIIWNIPTRSGYTCILLVSLTTSWVQSYKGCEIQEFYLPHFKCQELVPNFLQSPARSAFKRLFLKTPLCQYLLLTMSSTPLTELTDQECEKGQLTQRPPIQYATPKADTILKAYRETVKIKTSEGEVKMAVLDLSLVLTGSWHGLFMVCIVLLVYGSKSYLTS